MENVVFVKTRGTATVGERGCFCAVFGVTTFRIHFVSPFARTMFISSDGDRQMCTRRGLSR